MEIQHLEIPGPVVLIPKKFKDARGFLSETYVDEWFRAHVAQAGFVQDNHSYSELTGTIRGIHFQIPPHAQGKLVRVVRGAIWDVVVDLRQGSPHFGRHVGIELSAANWKQLWIPIGFGHAFCALEPDSEIVYKVTARYDRGSERGIVWDDPDLAIAWPVAARVPVLAERDRNFPRLRDIPAYFHYQSGI
jgi:dTDP-4-dehydrorhamnose 3,5-epimerase